MMVKISPKTKEFMLKFMDAFQENYLYNYRSQPELIRFNIGHEARGTYSGITCMSV